jgi:hypothetical protein
MMVLGLDGSSKDEGSTALWGGWSGRVLHQVDHVNIDDDGDHAGHYDCDKTMMMMMMIMIMMSKGSRLLRCLRQECIWLDDISHIIDLTVTCLHLLVCRHFVQRSPRLSLMSLSSFLGTISTASSQSFLAA